MRSPLHLQFSRDQIKVKFCTSTFLFLLTRSVQFYLGKLQKEKKQFYFTSKALLGPETRYQKIKKVALAHLTSAQRLRQYFFAHIVVVRTDETISQILGRLDVAGRMMKWPIELSEFDVNYESRKALKAQVFADVLAEMTFPTEENTEE